MDSSSSKCLASTERPVPIDADGGASSEHARSYWRTHAAIKPLSVQTRAACGAVVLQLLHQGLPIEFDPFCIPRCCRGVDVDRLERAVPPCMATLTFPRAPAQIFYRLGLHLGAESILD
jgi:hypothetical protein